MTALRDYVAKKNNSSATTDGFGGTKLRDYVSKTGSSLDEARKRIQERDKIYAKNEVIRRSQEEATKYSSEADYYNSIANAPGELLSGIKQQLKESAAAGTDIVSRLSPIEPMRNAVSGIREAKRLSGTVPISVAYQKGYEESRGRETLFEKVSGEKLTKEDGNINWPAARNFIVSGAEIPTLGFSTAFKSVGGNILKRIAQRTIKSTPEIAVNTALQQAEQMNTENIGTNLLANTLLISGLGNIGGEIRYKGNIAKGVEKVEAETGKLSVQDQYDLVDAIKNGADPDELAMNAGRIKRGEISAKEVNDKISEPFNETRVTDEPTTLNERIANSNDSDEIASLIKGKVSDNDLPTISRTLKTVSDEGTVARILDEYNPEKLKEELALKIATTDNEKKIATMLKGQVSDTDIPTVSRVLKGVENETEVAKILDEFRIKETPKIEYQEVSKVETDTNVPKQTEKPVEPKVVAKETTHDDPLLQEAGKYKSAEEFVKAQGDVVYRGEGGSNVAQNKALLAEGKHFASDSEYPKGFGKVGEYVLKPGSKVLDIGDSTFAEISKKLGIPERKYISPKELSSIAKEKGYSVLKYNGEYKSTGKQFTHTVDVTGDSYVPKSQLQDIWKKAHETPKVVAQKKQTQPKVSAGKAEPKNPKSNTNKSGLIKSLKKRMEESGVDTSKIDVPRLKSKMSMDEEKKKAFSFFVKNKDEAVDMVLRGEAPEGIRPGSLYGVATDFADETGDVDLAYRLSKTEFSDAAEAAAEKGREVKAYDTGSSNSSKVMKEVNELKIQIAERSGMDAKSEVKTAVKELKDAISKESSGDEGFAKLINAIKC